MPSVTNTRWIGFGVAALAVAMILLWRTWQAHDLRKPPAKSTSNAITAGIPSTGTGKPATKASPRTLPAAGMEPPPPVELPPLGTKVTEVLAALRGPADRGDVSAACRVGLELSRCYQQRFTQKFLQDQYTSAFLKDPNSADTARRLKQVEDNAVHSANDVALCEGIQTADTDEAWSYLMQAASAGNAAAAAYYGAYPPLDIFAEQSEALDMWSAHREEYVQIGIKSGDVSSLFQAQWVAETGVTWGGPTYMVPPDPYLSIEYKTAMSLALHDYPKDFTAQLTDAEKSLSADQIESATAAGHKLWERYFKAQGPVPMRSALTPLHPERC